MGRFKETVLALFLVAAVAAAAHAGAGTGLSVPTDPSTAGDSAPDFTLDELGTGTQVTLSKYFGKKVVMLEFWATWCNICKLEIPGLVKEYNEWKGKGYELIAVTLSDGGERDIKKINELK